MLFFVYIGATLGAGEQIPRSSARRGARSSSSASIYGWWRWSQLQKRAGGGDAPAIIALDDRPLSAASSSPAGCWDRRRTRSSCGLVERRAFNPHWQPQWWYHWCEVDLRRVLLSRRMRWRAAGTSSARLDRRQTWSGSPSGSRPLCPDGGHVHLLRPLRPLWQPLSGSRRPMRPSGSRHRTSWRTPPPLDAALAYPGGA